MASKAVSYLRVSGRGQVEGDGFERQRQTVAKFAKSSGLAVVAEFRDEGVSGTTDGFERPGLSELLVRIKSNGVRVVIVERADRLARDLLVGEVLLGEFRKLGVQVLAADGGGDLTVGDDDPTRVLIRQVLGAVSQFEKSVIVSKLRAARERKRRTDGRCEGAKPFGDLPGEADALERMKQLHRKPRGRDRMSYRKIADTLNGEGVTTRSGKPWSGAGVYQIIQRASR